MRLSPRRFSTLEPRLFPLYTDATVHMLGTGSGCTMVYQEGYSRVYREVYTGCTYQDVHTRVASLLPTRVSSFLPTMVYRTLWCTAPYGVPTSVVYRPQGGAPTSGVYRPQGVGYLRV